LVVLSLGGDGFAAYSVRASDELRGVLGVVAPLAMVSVVSGVTGLAMAGICCCELYAISDGTVEFLVVK
jgi:hypothetical protein